MRGRRPNTLPNLLFPFLVLHSIFPAMWLTTVVKTGPVPNDWLHLKIVADHFVAGDWTHLYSVGEQALNPGYFWRYPPFALYVVAPLAWLPAHWAYAVLAVVEVLALATSLWLLQRLEPFRRMRREWVLAIVLSAPALSTIITGQSSALIMLTVVGAASRWSDGHTVRACAILGLMAIKPNWGIVFGLMAIVRKEWKGATAMAGVALLLCALTLPLGLQIWVDFFNVSTANTDVLATYDPRKLITLRGFLEGLLGKSSLTLIAWELAAVALVLAAVLAWRAPGTPLRHLGTALLLAVAANPYASFYDALVLAVPATVWWAERERWGRGPWLVVATLLAVVWCSEQWLYSWGVITKAAGLTWLPLVSVVGPASAVWLVLAAHQARQSSRVAAIEPT